MAIEINPSTPSSPIPTVNGISVIWLGDWDNASVYRRNEGVFHEGSSYRANKTTSEEPSATALDWDLIAQGTTIDDSTISNHIANTSNPHNVTASQVGNNIAQWNADKIRGINVDDSAIGDGKVLKYNAATTNLEFDTVSAGASNLDSLTDVTITSPANGQALIYNNSTGEWTNQTLPSTGEVNTASNVGLTGIGIGVFKQKVGTDLEFKKLVPSIRMSIVDDAANSEIDLDVIESSLNLNNIGNTLSIGKGGTGASTAAAARTNLSVPSTTDLTSHTGNTSNPHSVTAAQVGNTTAQWNANQLQSRTVHNVTPTNGQVLTYNTANTRWEPQTPSAGGGGKVIQVVTASVPGWIVNTNGSWSSVIQANITPLSATSTIYITAFIGGVTKSTSNNTHYYSLAVYQDSTIKTQYQNNIGRRSDAYPEPVTVVYYTTADSTTSRLYSIRVNQTGGGSLTVSSVTPNYMVIMEIAP
ncbi:MAG: hypothetical protein RLZZ507_3600 [Cyanobacteriota bacterium]|jgi:hypothetical protein